MNRIDIEKYTDLDMNYSLEGANAYMLSPDMIKTIIETELGMSYDDMKKYVHGAKVNVTEEGIKKYIESKHDKNANVSYEPYTLFYYRKMIKIYKYRIAQLIDIIEILILVNNGPAKDMVVNDMKEKSKYYDLMINSNGEVYYKDLLRILEPLMYNFKKLKSMMERANVIDNYYSHQINTKAIEYAGWDLDNLYPTREIRVETLDQKADDGMIPLTEKQRKQMLKERDELLSKIKLYI